jgi:hypothetical protein
VVDLAASDHDAAIPSTAAAGPIEKKKESGADHEKVDERLTMHPRFFQGLC